MGSRRLSAAWRVVLWALASTATSALLYREHAAQLLDWSLKAIPGETQVYPLAGMAFTGAFILLRVREVWASLNSEAGLRSRAWVRLVGLLMVLAPLLIHLQQAPHFPKGADVSAVVLSVAWFGSFLALNPSTSMILAPYAALYVAFTMAPRLIYSLAGEALADFTSMAVGCVAAWLGIPLSQAGRNLEVQSVGGETILLTITPDCSSISSITVFLLLCGLMHVDLKKRPSTTALAALLGTASLMALNVMRIAVLLWVGHVGGEASLQSVHSWLGYAMFLSLYAVVAKAYVSSR